MYLSKLNIDLFRICILFPKGTEVTTDVNTNVTTGDLF